jgi:hypothetical protein
MILDELVALLSFDIDDKNLQAFNKKIDEGMTLMAGFSATIVAAGGTLFAIAQSTANAGDEASKMAQKFGIGKQAYQELMYAARGEAGALAGSMTFLSKAVDAANGGGKEQLETFKKLGVQYKDAHGKMKPTEDLIMDIAEGMAKMPDGTDKAALAMNLFGKSGTELIPFLNQGSKEIAKLRQEASDLGYVLDDEAIANSEAFNDGIDDMMNMVKGLRNTIGAGLMPVITGIVKKLQSFVKENRAIIATRLERFFSILADYAEKGWKIMTAMWDAANGLANVFGGLENVLQAVAYAMLAFASAKILFTIGSLIGLVGKLGTAFTIMNAKALMIPILIGAAVVALGLIIEDIVAFFQGKDSVTGIIVEKFKAMFGFLEEKFMSLGPLLKGIITVVLTPLRMLINGFQTLIDIISVVRGKMSVGDFLKNAGGRFLNNLGVTDGSLKGAIGLSNLASGSNASSGSGVQPKNSDFVSPLQSSQQQNNIEMPMTINVGAGTDPFAVGKEVQTQVGGGLEKTLRGTHRQFSGAKRSQ